MAAGAPVLTVPRWTDRVSGLQERYPRFWIGLGNLETRLLQDRLSEVKIEKPVYIAGLARSGTTILLEILARHPQLVSHRYRDFPPVLTPWLWNRFVDRAGSGNGEARERAHGDGIAVTPESPEAFEEVIWQSFFPSLHDPATSSVLTEKTSNLRFEKFYREHIRKLLLLRGGSRYLSKANYNVTRLRYLLKLFPDAKFVVPVRDPVSQVASLKRQHERFCSEHRRDDRLRRHMSRSGHYEFGLDRRAINSGDDVAVREIEECWKLGAEVEGWALYWRSIYAHVAEVLRQDDALRSATLVVSYEALGRNPAQVMQGIIDHCELPRDGIDLVAEARRTIRPSSGTGALDEKQVDRVRTLTAGVSLNEMP